MGLKLAEASSCPSGVLFVKEWENLEYSVHMYLYWQGQYWSPLPSLSCMGCSSATSSGDGASSVAFYLQFLGPVGGC